MDNSNQKYISILDEYINSAFTGLALLIRGDWGSGKTHFIKNTWRPHLENAYGDKSLLYISLNGISSPTDIYHRMFSNYLSDKKWKYYSYGAIETIGKLSASYFGFGDKIGINKLRKALIDGGYPNLNDKILCFDDLERIDTGKTSYKELFGFINTEFLEHKGIKIIFIANVDEIEGLDYPTFREKYIYKDILFIPDMHEVFDTIAISYNDEKDFYKYLISQGEVILAILNKIKGQNIRTLKYFIDSYFIIYKSCPLDTTIQDKFKVLLFTLCCSYLYKSGEFDSSESAQKILVKDSVEIIFMQMQKFDSKGEESGKESKKIDTFNKFFGEYINEYAYFQSILLYITDGYLDKDLLQHELTSQSSTNKPEHIEELDRLGAFETLTEEKFINSIHKVIDHLKAGNYDVYVLPQIENLLLHIKNKGLISDDIEAILEESLNLAITNFEYDFLAVDNFKTSHFGDKRKPRLIYDKILIKIDQIASDTKKSDIDEFFKRVFNSEGKQFSIEPKYVEEPIFLIKNPSEILTLIKDAENESIKRFNVFLHSHIKSPYFIDIKVTEKTNLLELLTPLKVYRDTLASDTIERYLINKSIKLIEDVYN